MLERVQVVDKTGKAVDIESVIRGDQSREDFDAEFDADSDSDTFEADE